MSKGAINGMTLPMSRELGKRGIRVVAILPGLISTKIVSYLKKSIEEKILG